MSEVSDVNQENVMMVARAINDIIEKRKSEMYQRGRKEALEWVIDRVNHTCLYEFEDSTTLYVDHDKFVDLVEGKLKELEVEEEEASDEADR